MTSSVKITRIFMTSLYFILLLNFCISYNNFHNKKTIDIPDSFSAELEYGLGTNKEFN